MPTLEEVARLAGVSRATASRAINGGSRVSPEAQAAVERRCAPWATPPTGRTVLVTRRTDSVALVVPEPDERVFSDPFFADAPGCLRSSGPHRPAAGAAARPPGRRGRRTLRYLRDRHVDGALVISHHRDDRLAEESPTSVSRASSRAPLVGRGAVSYVDVDNLAGGRIATEALLERGCRRIATVTGPADMTAAGTGWRAGGAPPGPRSASGSCTATSRWRRRAGDRRAAGDLPRPRRPVRRLRPDGHRCAPVLAARGDRVPDDVAVVGYDDLGVAERTDPR